MVEELLEEEKGVGWVIAIMGHGHIPDGWTFGLLFVVCAWMTLAAHQPTKEK